jgi:hypothetical protein
LRIELGKDCVHDSGRKEDFSVRNGGRSVVNDRTVEGLNQTLHAGLHVEVIFKKRSNIRLRVPKILLSKDQRGEEFFSIALEPIASYFDQCLLILIQDQSILGAIYTELVEQRTNLG